MLGKIADSWDLNVPVYPVPSVLADSYRTELLNQDLGDLVYLISNKLLAYNICY